MLTLNLDEYLQQHYQSGDCSRESLSLQFHETVIQSLWEPFGVRRVSPNGELMSLRLAIYPVEVIF